MALRSSGTDAQFLRNMQVGEATKAHEIRKKRNLVHAKLGINSDEINEETSNYSIYNHGYQKTRSRNEIHTINFFDMDDFVENILSAGDEPSPWPAVDDAEGIFNKHFVGVLKEIDDEFDETEILIYKANYYKLKCNKENYNWNKR